MTEPGRRLPDRAMGGTGSRRQEGSRRSLTCPLCRSDAEERGDRYRCEACVRDYPIFFGIPDFRIEAETWLDYEEDRERAARLVEEYEDSSFRDLHVVAQQQQEYVSEELTEHRIRQALIKIDRSRERMAKLGLFGERGDTVFLDVGCGTGALLVAASESFAEVVGIDVCLEGLVLAKKRFDEQGLAPLLVAGCVDMLPFREDAFDLVASEDVIEHVSSAEGMVEECARVTRRGGTFYFSTPNRFTVGKEPHVSVWGVGFVPRRFAEKYVSWFTSKPYKFTWLLSVRDIWRTMDAAGQLDYEIVLPDITETEVRSFSPLKRAFVRLYQFTKRLPGVRNAFLLVGPYFQVICKTVPSNPAPRSAPPSKPTPGDEISGPERE